MEYGVKMLAIEHQLKKNGFKTRRFKHWMTARKDGYFMRVYEKGVQLYTVRKYMREYMEYRRVLEPEQMMKKWMEVKDA